MKSETQHDQALEHERLKFTRRRYGSSVFTWVDYWDGREWRSLGDPWPCIVPARAEIEVAIDRLPQPSK